MYQQVDLDLEIKSGSLIYSCILIIVPTSMVHSCEAVSLF